MIRYGFIAVVIATRLDGKPANLADDGLGDESNLRVQSSNPDADLAKVQAEIAADQKDLQDEVKEWGGDAIEPSSFLEEDDVPEDWAPHDEVDPHNVLEGKPLHDAMVAAYKEFDSEITGDKSTHEKAEKLVQKMEKTMKKERSETQKAINFEKTHPIPNPDDDAEPSSFIEAGSPDSFEQLAAKIKVMEEHSKKMVEKYSAEAAAHPSSLLEKPLKKDVFADLQSKLEALRATTREQVYDSAHL